jgi:hypothetical protein
MVRTHNPIPIKKQKDLEQDGLQTYSSYMASKYSSIKHSSYFQVYEKLLSPYRGKAITFVEVGVYNGGSLFMWRDFFGPQARIIGVEFNPDAKRWEADGFEIHIGDQSDVHFWEDFYNKTGPVDVLLDDGGHSNEQQIVTVAQSAVHVNDGGLIVVEDTHTSYMSQFGNPSKYSFMNFAFDVVHSINNRFPAVKSSGNTLSAEVSSVGFYESIVSFHINRNECFVSTPTTNGGITRDAIDFRHHGTLVRGLGSLRRKLFIKFNNYDPDSRMRRSATFLFNGVLFLQHRLSFQKQKKYFG